MGDGGGSSGEDNRVLKWELGLPTTDELAPLSQCLISPELALAFNISPEPYRTTEDVKRASKITLSTICGKTPSELDDCKIQSIDNGLIEEADVADDVSKVPKRQRLVWTSQLHKRFVDVVSHLGIENAVPKTIMQLMNVEGLTRENVASHLQKYRLYLKRMQGVSVEGPSSSDHLSASTPNPHNLNKSGGDGHVEMPMPYKMMQIHGAYPWLYQHHGSFGSYHHFMSSNNK